MSLHKLLIGSLIGPLVCIAATGLFATQPAYAQAGDAFELSAEEALNLQIVELRLRSRTVLRSDIFAYDLGGDLYLPLGELLFELDFPIAVDAQARKASGWFLRETQIFELDVAQGAVKVAGQTLPLSPDDVRSDGQDLFVRADALSRWFRLNLEWSARDQRVSLAPDYLLPSEEYDRRARRSAGSDMRAPKLDLDRLTRIPSDATWLDWPYGVLDLRAGLGGRQGVSANLGLRGDLLRMTGELFGTLDDSGRHSARLTLGRTDPEAQLLADLLGDYAASAIRLGDIATGALPLLTDTATGLGFGIERRSTRRSDTFDSTRIEGAAPAGWQAELYRDGVLLGSLEVGAGGIFAFDDVPLRFGINRFRIELYGPSGERDSIEQLVDISSAFIQPGTVEYSFDAVLPGRGVFRDTASFVEQDFDEQEGTQLTSNRGLLLRGDLALGISESFSGQFGFQYRDDRITGSLTGLVSGAKRLGGSILSASLALQDDGEHALEAGFSTELSGISLVSRGQVFSRGFGVSSDTAALANLFDIRLDGRLDTGLFRDVAVWSLALRTSERGDGGRDNDISAQISGQLGGLSISQSAFWRSQTGLSGAQERLNTATSLSGSIGPWRLRAGMDFDLAPQSQLRTLRAEVSRRAGDWFLRAGLTHNHLDRSQSWSASVSRDFNGVNLGVDFRHGSDGRSEGLLTLRMAFDRRGSGNSFRFGRNAGSDGGLARVRVYEDSDFDGRFSPGERIIENAGLIVEPRARITTRENELLVDDLSLDRMVALAVDKDQLPDPYLVPATPGIRFAPRAGGVVAIDLPVVLSGEVEVSLADESGEAMAGVIASLSRCNASSDDPTMRERSAYDGVIFFQFVQPGCYVLEVPGFAAQQVDVTPGEVIRIAP